MTHDDVEYGDTTIGDAVVSVRVISDTPDVKTADSQKSSWQTYVVGTNSKRHIRILNRDQQRHQSFIMVNGTAGDFIIVGKREQMGNVDNPNALVGARLYVGAAFPYTSEDGPIYAYDGATTSTNPVYVTVIDERFET